MRRQLRTGIHDADHPVTGRQHITEGRPLHGMSVKTWVSATNADPTPLDPTSRKGAERRQYSPAERKLRANAFAARVLSLKYYIGLIGAPSII